MVLYTHAMIQYKEYTLNAVLSDYLISELHYEALAEVILSFLPSDWTYRPNEELIAKNVKHRGVPNFTDEEFELLGPGFDEHFWHQVENAVNLLEVEVTGRSGGYWGRPISNYTPDSAALYEALERKFTDLLNLALTYIEDKKLPLLVSTNENDENNFFVTLRDFEISDLLSILGDDMIQICNIQELQTLDKGIEATLAKFADKETWLKEVVKR